MKYDVLYALRDSLKRSCESLETADTYYKAVKRVLKDQSFSTAKDISIEKTMKSLQAIRSASEFSAAKNGLIALQALYPDAEIPDVGWLAEEQGKKSRRRLKRPDPLDLKAVKRKIHSVENDRLRLAYQTALVSGLRISELAAVTKEDLEFLPDGDRIKITVRRGKGKKLREVMTLSNAEVHDGLMRLYESSGDGVPIFYSASHLGNEATKLGFECHDLRRVFSQDYRALKRSEGSSAYEANGATMDAMGHSRYRILARYLRRRVIR